MVLAQLAALLAVLPERVAAARVEALLEEGSSDLSGEEPLKFGEELLLVGCACRMPFCAPSGSPTLEKHVARGPTYDVAYDGPLAPGQAKHAPEESDCPGPDASGHIDEPGTSEVGRTARVDMGTGATVRVVLLHGSREGSGVVLEDNGEPIREGQIVQVFDAAGMSEADLSNYTYLEANRLTSQWIESASRSPPSSDGSHSTADANPVLMDKSIVELETGMGVSTLDCMRMEQQGNDAAGFAKCIKYFRLIDVFHYRAIRTGRVLG